MIKISGRRTHDHLYLKDKRYRRNSKFLTKFFLKLIIKKNFKTLIDVGCANGDLLNFISKKIPNKNYVGTDVSSKLLKLAKKNNQKIKFIRDDITKKNYKKLKTDIIHCAGVLNIFDNVENIISQLISRCKRKGNIYITHYFNDYGIDYITRYRDNNNSNQKQISEMGWNVFSKLTLKKILKKNKKDLMRTWSTYYKGEKYFVNGLNFFNKIYFLIIKLK